MGQKPSQKHEGRPGQQVGGHTQYVSHDLVPADSLKDPVFVVQLTVSYHLLGSGDLGKAQRHGALLACPATHQHHAGLNINDPQSSAPSTRDDAAPAPVSPWCFGFWSTSHTMNDTQALRRGPWYLSAAFNSFRPSG